MLGLAPPPPEPLQLPPLLLLVLVLRLFHVLDVLETGLALFCEAAEGRVGPEGAEVEHGLGLAVQRGGGQRVVVVMRGRVEVVALHVVLEAMKPVGIERFESIHVQSDKIPHT